MLDGSFAAAIKAQLVQTTSEKTVDLLTSHWHGSQCDELAAAARRLLSLKGLLQKFLSYILTRITRALGYGDAVSSFVDELVTAVPVPWTAKVTAAARIIQLTGIWLCLINDLDLTDCSCLIDLVRAEGLDALGQLLAAATQNWREILDRVPVTGQY
jgi:hypothetical protein